MMIEQDDRPLLAAPSLAERAWLAENADAIAYQSRLCDEEGAFGDDVRSF